ncbi:MAG: N-acyl homoserine lactonase family protein [Chloroflexota bacterium]
MNIHAISTGRVKITHNWMVGQGSHPALRLVNSLADRRQTDWLPIFCYVIEHDEGLIVVDTGIPANANDPILFPPFMPWVQRAAPFLIASPEEEIGPQMRQIGLAPEDVRWVVLTHLHQDHEGGLHHFPNAEFLVSRAEWDAASGLAGRMGGYLNWRWFDGFSPALVDFTQDAIPEFAGSYSLTQSGDVHLVPTPGHSAGHLSVLVHEADHTLLLAGDAAYSQALLLANTVDGVGPDASAQQDSHQRMLRYAQRVPTVFLPSHEDDARRRLAERETLDVTPRTVAHI